MKTILFTLLSSFLFLTGFSQDELQFNVNGRYSSSVKQDALNGANYISDFVPGFPVNWISSYASVEITSTSNGKVVKVKGSNDELNNEQKELLRSADMGANVIVDVRYKYNQGTMVHEDDSRIYVTMTLVPDTEAEYVGGKEQMKKFLKENVISKISTPAPKEFGQKKVVFTVNEEGKVVNAKMLQPSGDPQMDKLLIEGISKMPSWKPAQNSKGVKVKQEFEFNVGSGGC